MRLECGDTTYTCLSVPRKRYLAKGWLVPKTSKVSDRYECNYWANTTLTQTTFGRVWRTHNTPNFLYRLRPQADNIDGVVKEQPQQNLKFADAGAKPPIPAPSISFKPDQDESAHLGEFLSRPVRIANLLWTVGDPIGLTQTIYPWKDYFNTSTISNKLKNYARLRCKLHLKIVANTSPFLYGALRYCYVPVDGHLRNQYLTDADQITFSQAPGVWIQPQDNTSFEMELPFLSPRTWIDTTKQSELQSLGVLYGITYASLASANGVTANANVQIYAWASEVELAGLTTQLVLQSDEYEAGPISSTATAVADVAAKLKNVPVIGSLAKATEIGARTTGAIASLFGYSNPPVIDDVKAYAPKSFHSMAATETGFPMDKLSLDPKNEITVDKTVTGADAGDPLVISRFAGRESFVTGCGWTDANPPGFQLMRIPITPRTYGGTVTANYNTYNETPACRAAAMFSLWRGSMVFKLKFIKSRFHTGRVAITWDPAGSPGATYETECVTRIVDIQTESEVSFVVPFKAADAWLKTTGYQKNWAFTGAGSITYDPAAHNGVLRVEVLNELTGPAATSSITVLLMSAAGADIQFAAPQALPLWSSLVPQSDEWSLDEAEQLAAPAEDGVQPQVTAVTVGETVVSLRPLLHRSSLAYTGIHGDSQIDATTFVTSATIWNTSYIPRFPLNFGYNGSAPNWANGVIVTGGTFKFGFVPVHPLVWVGECFAGYRGGIVHQLNVVANGMPFLDALKAERDNRNILLQPTKQAVNRFSVTTAVGNKGSSLPRTTITQSAGVDREVTGHRGMAMTNMNTQSGLSIVTPQYSKWKFRPIFGDRRDKYNDQTDDESIRVTSVSRCGSTSSTVDAGWPVLQDFVSGGVDFDLIYFVYVPRMYSFNTPGAVDTLF